MWQVGRFGRGGQEIWERDVDGVAGDEVGEGVTERTDRLDISTTGIYNRWHRCFNLRGIEDESMGN
jgi:hypothetical protein